MSKLHHGQRWGGWRLNAENLTLELIPEGRDSWLYYIDLERVWDSASLCNWIFQVNGHSFDEHGGCGASITQDLLDAIDEIFHPQSNLCSVCINKTIKPTAFLRERIAGGTQ